MNLSAVILMSKTNGSIHILTGLSVKHISDIFDI